MKKILTLVMASASVVGLAKTQNRANNTAQNDSVLTVENLSTRERIEYVYSRPQSYSELASLVDANKIVVYPSEYPKNHSLTRQYMTNDWEMTNVVYKFSNGMYYVGTIDAMRTEDLIPSNTFIYPVTTKTAARDWHELLHLADLEIPEFEEDFGVADAELKALIDELKYTYSIDHDKKELTITGLKYGEMLGTDVYIDEYYTEFKTSSGTYYATKIAAHAFYGEAADYVDTIYVGGHITHIGDFAFTGSRRGSGIYKVTLGESIEYLGYSSFSFRSAYSGGILPIEIVEFRSRTAIPRYCDTNTGETTTTITAHYINDGQIRQVNVRNGVEISQNDWSGIRINFF